jgi:hypothetical protein
MAAPLLVKKELLELIEIFQPASLGEEILAMLLCFQ